MPEPARSARTPQSPDFDSAPQHLAGNYTKKAHNSSMPALCSLSPSRPNSPVSAFFSRKRAPFLVHKICKYIKLNELKISTRYHIVNFTMRKSRFFTLFAKKTNRNDPQMPCKFGFSTAGPPASPSPRSAWPVCFRFFLSPSARCFSRSSLHCVWKIQLVRTASPPLDANQPVAFFVQPEHTPKSDCNNLHASDQRPTNPVSLSND
jgi:hypothetical protein